MQKGCLLLQELRWDKKEIPLKLQVKDALLHMDPKTSHDPLPSNPFKKQDIIMC